MADDTRDEENVVRHPKAKGRKLTVRSGAATAQVNMTDDHLIDGILPQGSMAALYGPPGSTKSFWCLTAALTVALGDTIHGRQAEQGNVVYIAQEGAGMFPNRVAAYCQHHGVDPAELGYFHLITDPLDLRSPTSTSTDDLLSACEEIGPIRLIIIDTLARVFGGGNENSPEDMGLFLTNCSKICKYTGASLLLVHHSGKDVAQGMRGHSSLLGAVDTELKITRNDKGALLTVSKMRDGEDGIMVAYRTVEVSLGTNAKGREIKSLTIEGAPVDDVKETPRTRLGDNEAELMRQVQLLTAEPNAKLTPYGIGWPGTPVTMALQAEVVDRAIKNLSPRKSKEMEMRRTLSKAVRRLVEAKGMLGRNDGYLWIIR